MDIAQEEKAALLQRAAINSSVGELCRLYDELGDVEMSAPALGLACRFRGPEMVRALVQKGATFDFPSTRKTEETYNCYIGRHYGNYRTNYAVYLLKIFGEDTKIFCLKGMTLDRSAEREQGEPLPFLSDEERVDVLRYLLENREKIAFHPEELLFYAIYFQDTAIVKELKKQGVRLSEIRVQKIADGAIAMDGYWFEYILLTQRLADEDYLETMQQMASELDGKLFHYTGNIYEITRERFRDVRVFEFFLASFKREKMNKNEIMRGLIDRDVLDALPVVEREGWLDVPRKRDEMIAYASENNKTEALAWLLDFKNRTADFAAEQEKADKKLTRVLNASPGSAAALKQIWSYRKEADGTIRITNYKGTDTEVIVPEQIGKNIVTAVGDGAFSGDGGGFNSRVTREQADQHRKIAKIVLPGTLLHIGRGAFYKMPAIKEIDIPERVQEISEFAFGKCSLLKSVTIPEGVKEIGAYAFMECVALQEITIPGTVEEMGDEAFARCSQLEKVQICGGVKEIGTYAFDGCFSLKEITIPGTVEKIGEYAFAECSKLKEVCLCEGIKEIDEYAFKGCTSLKKITIPATVESIGGCAFAGCRRLEAVCICGEVEKIGKLVFFDCSNLKEISVLKSIPNRILGETFDMFPKLAVSCPMGSRTEAYCKKKGMFYRNIREESDYEA